MPTPFLPELKVPAGWTVMFRGWDDDVNEDLLQLRNEAKDQLVDVGWYPEGASTGEFALVVFAGDFSGGPLLEFRTRERTQLLDRLQAVLLGEP